MNGILGKGLPVTVGPANQPNYGIPYDAAQFICCVGRLRNGSMDLLGTAFAVSRTCFATAAHVVGPSDTGLHIINPRIKSLQSYQDTLDDKVTSVPTFIKEYDPVHDIAILQVPGMSIELPYQLGGTDNLLPGASAVTVGFPHAGHGRLVLTQQSSSVGARVLLGVSTIPTKNVILNIQTRPGQSGSPVFSKADRVSAMILGSYAPAGSSGIKLGDVDPATLHQTTHAVSVEYIKELV